MHVLIAGGGIGGLTLALSLHQAGISATVCEAVPHIAPLGVGINILPHAMRELTELGLGETVEVAGIPTAALAYHSARGQLIWQEPRGRDAGYHWPQISIHRGSLHMILLHAAQARLGAAAIRTGLAYESHTEDAGSITATFRNRTTGTTEAFTADILVGADGIHSALRARFHPHEGAPIWNGAILWRGTTTAPAFLGGDTMIMAGHERQKFVCYPIAETPSGQRITNWVAELKFPLDHPRRREDWTRHADPAEFAPAFADWRFPWLDIPALIRATPRAYEYPMVDRDPLPQWAQGRATLMGDAAHPMYPIGSNGASQAILDARVLARELRTHGPTPEALAAYEAERRPATTRIIHANRGNGPEQVMQLVQERAPNGFADITTVLTPDELHSIVGGYKHLAGFDRETLNNRPPILPPTG